MAAPPASLSPLFHLFSNIVGPVGRESHFTWHNNARNHDDAPFFFAHKVICRTDRPPSDLCITINRPEGCPREIRGGADVEVRRRANGRRKKQWPCAWVETVEEINKLRRWPPLRETGPSDTDSGRL